MSEELLTDAIHRPAGLLALYEGHRAQIQRFLRARTRDPAEAEDILQELWIRVRESRTGPIANARAYLFQMANNLALDRLRERRRRAAREQSWIEHVYATAPGPGGELQAIDPDKLPEEQLVDAEERRQLEAAIAALPEGARRAFCLHKVDGLSHAQVAARLGISRSGVEKHIAVAMRHLRHVLGNCGSSGAATSESVDG